MFDFSKLGDLSKMANQAKQVQERQDRALHEQTELLRKISSQLDRIIALFEK